MKTKSIPLVLLLIAFAFAAIYVVYKIWDVFGFWRIVLTSLASWLAIIPLGLLARARSERDGQIIYNPKEWPKLIHMLISAGIAYYLYSFLLSKGVVGYDYTFGIIYLLMFSVVPIAISVYRLFRDRNDYISIGDGKIGFRDNEERGMLDIDSIKDMEIMAKGGLIFHFKDGGSRSINLNEMNFNVWDVISLTEDLKSKVPMRQKSDA